MICVKHIFLLLKLCWIHLDDFELWKLEHAADAIKCPTNTLQVDVVLSAFTPLLKNKTSSRQCYCFVTSVGLLKRHWHAFSAFHLYPTNSSLPFFKMVFQILLLRRSARSDPGPLFVLCKSNVQTAVYLGKVVATKLILQTWKSTTPCSTVMFLTCMATFIQKVFE